ncbi:MAG: molybdenum cofactor biosynthesis protein MoaE [Synergistetes bacterium]|nr:molybdenum cofactor biosynthesis protein MoaE [Synergistota bacterium]MCX8127656.1 molybdenum cofactor biosynthesis protein MoaE [Synergistota bacterium]MDW8191428.1 molybdenum cofactor biosynthesis protein MoaE [Synergistota bacterium]
MKPSIENWIKEVKETANPENLGMILIHNGIVRETSKREDKKVKGINLSYNKELLEKTIEDFSKKEGIEKIKAWINEGVLKVGDDIMLVLVAGRYRTDILPTFEALIEKIKKEIVNEEEIF